MTKSLVTQFLEKNSASKVGNFRSRLEAKVATERAKAARRETKKENIKEIRLLIKEYLALKFKGRNPIKLTTKEKQRLKALGTVLKKEGVNLGKAGFKIGSQGLQKTFLSPAARKKLSKEKNRNKRPSQKRKTNKRSKSKKR